MNNACPGCGAVYNVTAKDIGRHLKCKKCGTPMVIGEGGIEAESAAASQVPQHASLADDHDDPVPLPRRQSRNSVNTAELTQAYQKYGSVIAMLVFGAGAFLIIFHLFMPLVGQAKVAGRKADKREAELSYQLRVDDLNKDKDAKDKVKTLDDLRKAHEEDTRSYDKRIASAEFASDQSQYWDRYFMMSGFLLVMVGSLLFMMPNQPLLIRIVGAVVVTAQMVFVFIVFLGLSATSR